MQKIKLMSWYIFTIVSLFYCYEFFLRISPGILVEQLLAQYHVTALGIGEFASSYYIGYVLMQIPAGILFDKFRFKWVVSLSLISCVIGSSIFITADQVYIGILGRFILGCGSAFAFVGTVTFAKKYLADKHFTLWVALVISLGTIFAAFGQVFAARIIEYINWHRTIDGMATWGVVLALAITIVPQRYFEDLDTKPTSWTFIFKQFKEIINLRLVWLNGLIGSLFYLPTSVIAATWGVELFTEQYHFTKPQGSYAITCLFLGWAIGGPIFGYFVKFGYERQIISGAAAIAAAIIMFVLFGHQLTAIGLYLALFAFGLASSAQVLVWHIFSRLIADKRLAGTAAAFTNLLIMCSIAVWDLVLGKVIDALHQSFSASARSFTAFDLRVALLSLPLLIMVVIVLVWFLPKFTVSAK